MKLIHKYNIGFPVGMSANYGTGALIALGVGSAVAGIAGTAMTNSSNYNAAMTGISASKEENQLNRDYNTAEAEKARNFSSTQAQIQRDYDTQVRFQNQDWMKDMTEYVAKNSANWQMQGARQAGLNPNVAFGNGVQQVSMQSAPNGAGGTSAPTASPASASMGLNPAIPQYQNPFASLPGAFQQVATGVNQLAEAKKAGADVSMIEQQIKNLTIEESYKKVLIDGAQISNSLSKLDLQYKDKMLVQDLEEQVVRIATAKNENEFIKAQTKVQNGLSDLNKALEKYHGQNAELLRVRVANYGVEVKNMMSQTAANYADADLKRVQKSGQEFTNVALKIDSDIASKTAQQKLNVLESQLRKHHYENDRDRAKAEVELRKLRERIIHYNKYDNAASFDDFWDNFPIIGGIVRGLAK